MKRPYWMHFLAPDDGGGTVTMPAPSSDAGLTQEAADAEVLGFDPPNLDDILKGEPPKEEPAKKPEPEPKKPEAKKPDQQQKPPEKKPGEKPAGEPPAKQLREELERTRAELAEFRSKAEQPHPKVQEMESTLAELQKERDALKAEREEARRELEMRDPLASQKVREFDAAFEADHRRALEYMPELGEGAYNALMRDFFALPRGTADYAAKLGEFEQKVEDTVGTRKFGLAMEHVRKGYEVGMQRARMTEELKRDAGKLAHEGRVSEWTKHNGEVSEALGKALEVPEDLETVDPFSPLLYVSRALQQESPKRQKEIMEAVDGFTRKVFAGAKPRTAADFPGMSEKQIQEALEAEGKWHTETRPIAVRNMKQGLVALAMMRPLLAELSKLRERVKQQAEATPPDPANPGARKEADDDDIASYTPPEIRI